MNRKKITALLLSSVMALTPAMPAMAEQSTIVNYVDGTTDSTVETPDVTPTPLPEKKEGWETVDGVKYYYVNGESVCSGEIDLKDPAQRELLMFSMLCNDSTNQNGQEIGDPTETALINLGSLLEKIMHKYVRSTQGFPRCRLIVTENSCPRSIL